MILADTPYYFISLEDENFQPKSYNDEKKASYENSSSFDSFEYIEIGKIKYKLLAPLKTATIYIPNQKLWVCHTNDRFKYVGISKKSRDAAIEDFIFQIHVRFQQLYSKRPFEMIEDEHNEWIKLANTIDLLHYKTTTPLKLREIGCVSFKNYPYPYRIKWLTDENYIINPSKVPGELMNFRPGQWVEAIVERCPVNHNVLGISSVRKIKFHIPRSGEAQRYWDNMERIELDEQSS